MHEPSDGIAEEVERQLQLALAAAAIAARRAIAARGQALEQARRDSDQAARAAQARIDAQRLLAAERLRPVFDDAWWETAGPQEIADMWGEANSWRDPDASSAKPTIFDHAAHRIREEVRDRSGLDPTQVVALAAVQELEHEHQATLAQSHWPAARCGGRRARRAARVRRPAATRAAPRASRRCGRARACHSRRERSPISPKPARPWRRHALPPWPQRSRDAPPATARHESSRAAGESRDLGFREPRTQGVWLSGPVGVAC